MPVSLPVRRGLRRLLTVLALLPLIVLLARQLPQLPYAPLLAFYGFAVLTATVAVFYLAYARYVDPSEAPAQPRHTATFPPLPPAPRVSLLVAVKDEATGSRRASVDDRQRPPAVAGDRRRRRAPRTAPPRSCAALAAELPSPCSRLPRTSARSARWSAAPSTRRGDVLAFTDSDCVLAPDALRRCVAALLRQPGPRRGQRPRPRAQRRRDDC